MQTLNYSDAGDGYPIVLLHGFCESKKLWDVFSAILSIKYRVITIDLPGFGKSPMLSEENPNLNDYATQVHATLQRLKITQCIMIGHSLGGYVTLAFAEHHPELLQGIGLFHSTSFADSDEKKINRDKAVDFIEKYGNEKFVANLFPSLFSPSNTQKLNKQIAYFVRDAAKTDATAVIYTTKAMKNRPDRREILEKVDFPVLFIIGKDDASIPLQQSLMECYLPAESMVCFLENVGHMGMIEAPEKSRAFTEQFINYCLNTLKS